jgi:predicted patatin/cPLA2 family phospholipase
MFSVQENVSGMMNFPIGGSGQRLVFTTPVIDHFLAHRQTRWWHREAAGHHHRGSDRSAPQRLAN